MRAHRDIEILCLRIPGSAEGPGASERLLLIHVRKVVGQIHYRACTDCGEGVITAMDIDESYHSRKPHFRMRALSHLRFRHPQLIWRNTAAERGRRNLLQRVSHLAPGSRSRCTHSAP